MNREIGILSEMYKSIILTNDNRWVVCYDGAPEELIS